MKQIKAAIHQILKKIKSVFTNSILALFNILKSVFQFLINTAWIWFTLFLNIQLMNNVVNSDLTECITWHNGVGEIIDLSEEEFGASISFLFMLIVLTVNLMNCVKRFFNSKGALTEIFKNLILTYLMIIINFSILYYSICKYNDFKFSATNHNEYVVFYKSHLLKDEFNQCRLKIDSTNQQLFIDNKTKWSPTITGINTSTWYSLDYPSRDLVGYFFRDGYIDLNFKKRLTELEKISLIESYYITCIDDNSEWNTKIENNKIVLHRDSLNDLNNIKLKEGFSFGKLNSDEKSAIYFDCFIYSAKVLSNFEVGNYSPNTSFTKFLTAIEAVVGIILFVFALGLVFTRNTSEKNTE